jgi:hypothetical protein
MLQDSWACHAGSFQPVLLFDAHLRHGYTLQGSDGTPVTESARATFYTAGPAAEADGTVTFPPSAWASLHSPTPLYPFTAAGLTVVARLDATTRSADAAPASAAPVVQLWANQGSRAALRLSWLPGARALRLALTDHRDAALLNITAAAPSRPGAATYVFRAEPARNVVSAFVEGALVGERSAQMRNAVSRPRRNSASAQTWPRLSTLCMRICAVAAYESAATRCARS